MYTSISGKNVSLYKDNGCIIRRFMAKAEVVSAVVSGSGKEATVAISMKNGKTDLYRADGTVIRRG